MVRAPRQDLVKVRYGLNSTEAPRTPRQRLLARAEHAPSDSYIAHRSGSLEGDLERRDPSGGRPRVVSGG